MRAYNRKRAADPAFRQEQRDAMRRKRATDPAVRDRERRYARERYWRDPERFRAAAREYAQQNVERVRERRRRWYEANREHVLEYARRYREAHPDEVRAYQRRWYQENRDAAIDYARIQDANERAERWGCEGTLTLADWLDALDVAGGRCTYCGDEPDVPVIDHQVPLSRGGRNDRSNIVFACNSCNCRKGTKTPDEYATWLGVAA